MLETYEADHLSVLETSWPDVDAWMTARFADAEPATARTDGVGPSGSRGDDRLAGTDRHGSAKELLVRILSRHIRSIGLIGLTDWDFSRAFTRPLLQTTNQERAAPRRPALT